MIFLCILCTTSAAFESLIVGQVERIADGFQFTEGPVWMLDGRLLFSDIPADTIHEAPDTVYRHPSGKANGLAIDTEGRLLACEHWNRRVTRTESDGSITVLAAKYEDKLLNSPNDIAVHSSGALYFTDPPYGLEGRPAELDFCGIYRIDINGDLTLLEQEMNRPNGLAFSPDESLLYVADSGDNLINVFDVQEEGELSNRRLFVGNVPVPDGMAIDVEGRIWVACTDGVRVYHPDGHLLETIEVPRSPANCTFGGAENATLYITARDGVYKVETRTKGVTGNS